MPRYNYRCSQCDSILELIHSISVEEKDCHLCESKDCLTRIPSSFMTLTSKKNSKKKVGSLVKDSIEKFREDLNDQKKEATREYEPS